MFVVEETLEDKVRAMISELDTLDRTYFGKDRTKQMKTKLEEATTMLDTKLAPLWSRSSL